MPHESNEHCSLDPVCLPRRRGLEKAGYRVRPGEAENRYGGKPTRLIIGSPTGAVAGAEGYARPSPSLVGRWSTLSRGLFFARSSAS